MAAVAADDAATFSFDLTIFLLNELGEHKLKADWEFLRTFRESIHKWSNADKVFAQKPISLALKIEALAEEIIAPELTVGSSVGDYETKTKHLMAEIEEALEDHLHLILGGGQSFQVYFPARLPFWVSFVDCLLLNLKSMKGIAELNISDQAYGLSNRLRFIQVYIVNVIRDPKFPSSTTNDDDVVGIYACLTHVASVVLRVAIRCCHYWFSYKTDRIHRVVETSMLSELVSDLHDEINPANPNFMEFHLNFILALCESSGGIQVALVHYFCSYLFYCEEGDFREEVSSLVTLFVNSSKLGKEDNVVQNFFPEINAVLVGMVSLFEAKCSSSGVEMDNSPQCAELLTTICLLKTELYLMVLVRKMHNTTSFSDMLSDWTAIRFQFIEIPENLRRFSRELPYEKVEDGKKFLAFIELLAQEVESLFQSFRFKEITEFTAKNSLLLRLFKILSFKEEAFLLELFLKSSDAATFMAYGGKDQIAPLLHQLEYFTLILLNQRVKDREDISRAFVQIEIFARRMTCFYNSFLSNEITRDNLALSFSELLDKVKHVMKAKRKEIGPPFPLSDFPRTFKLGFIDFLLRNLQELLQYDPESIAPFKDHIEEIQLHLESLSPFLTKVSELDINKHPELKDLGSCVINVAYNVEYVIDAMEVGAQWQDFFWFYDILEELRLVYEQVCRIHLTTFDAKVQDAKSINQVSLNMVSRYGTPSINDVVVDLSDEEQVIVDQLTRGSSRRVVVSIVGMPGIGKTTLARKVYNSENVKSHFHCRAWCTVSQVYEKRLLLLEILSDIHGLTDEIHQMNDEDLESKLRQCLLKNKYLIVMDDVWDVKPWNDLKSSFPDDGNRSRILITGRLCKVALEIEPDGDPHSLRLLSDDESWKLLEGKVFHGDSCPQELLAVGKEIARHCKGLPLAIVAIAGLLERTEKSQNWWRRIAENLSSQIINDPETRCMEILELSYKHLPEYLKVCFLYLGVLLEDKDIPVSKLIRFWLAEGFIPKTETKSFEDVAEDCLMDLINRSLVIISKRRSNGKVKSCRLHDLILDFCRSKAKDENFLQLVTRCDTPYASFPSSDYGFEFDFYHHLCPVAFASYRLVIFLKRNHFFESRPSGPGTRSLVLFASTDSEP
ncbi:hypothetical protein ACH5RR_032686 [Cinchona calisaya]|uniref:Uncharacterized protein n=1 Tax=Cinchona calisaya TaxID=153742 RepID=A0ABD2YLA0_9GENT